MWTRNPDTRHLCEDRISKFFTGKRHECHYFLHLNPYDKGEANQMISDRDHPENTVKVGELVIWDAHFGPNEGRLPLDNLLKNNNFRLVHLTREKEPFTVLGGYTYEI